MTMNDPSWAPKALAAAVSAKRLASLDEQGKADALMALRLISAAKYAAHEAAQSGVLRCGESMPTDAPLEAATRLLNSLFVDYGLIPAVQDDELLGGGSQKVTASSDESQGTMGEGQGALF